MEWAGGLESLIATWEESAAVSSAASQAPPLPPPSSAHPLPHLQLQLVAKQFFMVAVHLGASSLSSISTFNNLSSFFFAFAQRRREDLSSFQSRSNRQSQQGVGNPTAAALALLCWPEEVVRGLAAGERMALLATVRHLATGSQTSPRTPGPRLTVMEYSVTPQKV